MSAVAVDPFALTRTPEQPGPGPLSPASLRALELVVGRRVDGLLSGDYRSAFAGIGSELFQVRPYEPGDDVRRIEWNVTARTGETHVRVELAERVLVTWLVLDALRDAPAGDGSLGQALKLVDALAVQRSLVVVVSDFRGKLDWRMPLLRL